MIQKISMFLKKYSVDVIKINRLIVSAFISINNIEVRNNKLIKNLIISENNDDEYKSLVKFIDIVNKSMVHISIENLIELFEFVISPADKEVNGAVYTPYYIREYITNETLKKFNQQNWSTLKIADISCGCGGFFVTVTETIKKNINISFDNLYRNYFGVDIEAYSIERTKILLSLYAIQNGEDIEEFCFNLYKSNSLEFDWNVVEAYRLNGGFDIILGNPPYVGSSKITDETKALLNNWEVTQTGKTDLYIPFFQIAIENLNPNGILGYITVNNFYRSLNGRAFRYYMANNLYNLKMIDFGAEQIFKGRSTYTCICLITKEVGCVQYLKSKSNQLNKISNDDFIELRYDILSNHEGWLLQSPEIAGNIKKIETTGIPLGRCFNIRNGFATLKNEIFILNVENEDSNFFYVKMKDGKVFPIEKTICRNVIKPNTLKSEDEIAAKLEKLLFPYIIVDSYAKIISEADMQQNFPCAYNYLLFHKKVLSGRDKGKREYEEWFAFGRSQALNIYGYKLLFPYIADYPHFVISDKKDLLFYNGYSLVSDDLNSLKIVQKILRSKIFWYYIKHTSKPYGSDYFALAKNYIKNFGVIQLTECQKRKILALKSSQAVDDFLMELYNLKID